MNEIEILIGLIIVSITMVYLVLTLFERAWKRASEAQRQAEAEAEAQRQAEAEAEAEAQRKKTVRNWAMVIFLIVTLVLCMAYGTGHHEIIRMLEVLFAGTGTTAVFTWLRCR